MRCHFTVYRFDPKTDKKPRYQEYAVNAEPTDKILDCLNKIRWEQDPTLAYRYSCAHGICGSDALMINGRIELACQKLVRDFKTGNNFVIEPLPLFDVVKDLIVDLEPFFEKYRQVQPYWSPAKRNRIRNLFSRLKIRSLLNPRSVHPVCLLHGRLPHESRQAGLSRAGRAAARFSVSLIHGIA